MNKRYDLYFLFTLGSCLDTMGQKPGGKIGASGCHGLGGNQIFAFTQNSQIMTDDSCLDFSEKTGL